MSPTRLHHVVIVAFPGLQSLDAVGPLEVFSSATRVAAGPGALAAATDVSLVSVDGGPVRSESGLELGTAPLPATGDGRPHRHPPAAWR